MEEIIKNCRGVKKFNDCVNRTEKRNHREIMDKSKSN